jgi:pimeloyl-ACP methyl ester carboxylesterase
MQRAVRTPDGRTLAVEESGDPDGRPIVVHMGTPNSRHLYLRIVLDAVEKGLRLISYDRPGYGDSAPHPGRTVADAASDVRTICAELGLERVATWGISGGGPHALACAALLPDLVAAAACLASLAPYGPEDLDYFAGMGDGNVEDFRLFLTDEAAAKAKTDRDRNEVLATAPEDAIAGMASLVTAADAAVLHGELAKYLVTSAQDGLAPGSEGWWEDNCTLKPWGFDLADITVPVLLLHGRQDKFVPFGHGEWLAAHIPGVDARLLDHDGHLTLLEHRIPEVHSWLAAHLPMDAGGP